ncbi:DinB family protein [Psychrobacillus sp.]|uniref:DinB family protein n=1 Tax=Psychrobacillus sp. TaxID=1871623 RepID=UPI0028BF3E77|nr:DinB family protein [Psychrobacillus sp.]
METIKQLNFARTYTLGKLRQSNEAAWDIQPKGFNNTIRWNIGHIFVLVEKLTQKAIPTYELEHAEWIPLFAPGTTPKGWEVEPPTNEELVNALKNQSERIKAALEGNLQNVLAEPVSIGKYHQMNTVEAIVQFLSWHEGVHSGIIHALNRATIVE